MISHRTWHRKLQHREASFPASEAPVASRMPFSYHFPCVSLSRASRRGRRPDCSQRPIVDIRKGSRQDWRGREPTAKRDQRWFSLLSALSFSHLRRLTRHSSTPSRRLRIHICTYLGASFREAPKISEGGYGVKKFGNGDRARSETAGTALSAIRAYPFLLSLGCMRWSPSENIRAAKKFVLSLLGDARYTKMSSFITPTCAFIRKAAKGH